MLDGLVPVDYVGHCGEKLLSGGRLVIQGHLGPNVAEAAVFRKLELDRKLVDHRVFGLRFREVLRPREPRGKRFVAANSKGLRKNPHCESSWSQKIRRKKKSSGDR